MAVSTEINRVKFIAEDFQTYRDEANLFFQTNYPEDYNNLIATDLGNALMDQIAFAMQSLSFMVNRRSSELFLSTARLNKSITKLARMLGYPIKAAAPATTDLTMVLKNGPYAFPNTIKVGYQFRGPGDTIYEYEGAVDIVIPAGNTTAAVPITEGTSRKATFVSDGSENQQFLILGIPVGQFLYSGNMVLTVDGVEWTRQPLIKYEQSNIYEVLFTESPPKLRFGDGIAGNIPPASSQIVLEFRFGKGANGAIGKNQISGVVTNLVTNGINIPMTLTNTVSSVGEDPEDIRHIRSYASSFFRTQNAAVVKQDYDTIAGLQSGVGLADAQIMRGIDNDITIQSDLSTIRTGEAILLQSVSGMAMTGVSGVEFLGVSGSEYLGVSGISSLYVDGTSGLSVSGTSYIGKDVSGNITGMSYLGVQGIPGLFVGGTSSLGVSGLSFLGVSGISDLGVSGQGGLIEMGLSGVMIVESGVSGLSSYLSQAFSDTSKANNVQIVVLSVDSNNRYISPSTLTLQTVESTVQTIADAVVTVKAVDGISKVVDADVTVELGISQTAVKADVEQKSLNALTGTTTPFGIMVKRVAGKSLYISDIENAIRDANATGDLVYVNVHIDGPTQYLDAANNFIVGKQQIVQNGIVSVKAKYRFLSNGERVVT